MTQVEGKSYYESYVLDPIRAGIRPYFFPFLDGGPVEYEQQIQAERKFFEAFWDSEAVFRPKFKNEQTIREKFTYRMEQIPIHLNGKPLTVTCTIIETKDCSRERRSYNFIHVMGMFCKADTNIMGIYPLLSAYLDKENRPPARFILISQYETRDMDGSLYKVKTLDEEAGKILNMTVKALSQKYGDIHHLLAHSLGAIVTAAALKHFCIEDSVKEGKSLTGRVSVLKRAAIPKHITFDRGPSSVESLSKLYTGGFFLLPFARLSGWDLDFGKEIANFIKITREAGPSITVINTAKDHRFGKGVNLYDNPYIQELAREGKITTVLLDQPMQCVIDLAQHSLRLDKWNKYHVIEGSGLEKMKGIEKSFAHAIIEQSIP